MGLLNSYLIILISGCCMVPVHHIFPTVVAFQLRTFLFHQSPIPLVVVKTQTNQSCHTWKKSWTPAGACLSCTVLRWWLPCGSSISSWKGVVLAKKSGCKPIAYFYVFANGQSSNTFRSTQRPGHSTSSYTMGTSRAAIAPRHRGWV